MIKRTRGFGGNVEEDKSCKFCGGSTDKCAIEVEFWPSGRIVRSFCSWDCKNKFFDAENAIKVYDGQYNNSI